MRARPQYSGRLVVRMLSVLFLRLFAMNLGRGFRNSPDKACSDAVLQMVWGLAFVYCAVISLIPMLVPEIRSNKALLELFFFIAVMLFIYPFMSWLKRKFGHYERTPEVADRYRGSRERLKTSVTLGLIFVAPTVVVFVSLRALRL